jgi:hypothetical protein
MRRSLFLLLFAATLATSACSAFTGPNRDEEEECIDGVVAGTQTRCDEEAY